MTVPAEEPGPVRSSELVALVLQLKRGIEAERTQFDRDRGALQREVERLATELRTTLLERDALLAECQRVRALLAVSSRGEARPGLVEETLRERVRADGLEADLAAARKLIAELEREAASDRLRLELDAQESIRAVFHGEVSEIHARLLAECERLAQLLRRST